MKHNKHIHDEDYDINIKLMVPLLSMLVCTICLCATTWAWYTASVSTGVNSIVAGVNATVTAEINGSPVSLNNGSYTLGQHEILTLKLKGENAANGYYALIDITNQTTNPSASETALQTLFSLFVNRVYAENTTDIQKCVYFTNTEKTITITNNDSTNKIVTITIVWANQTTDVNGRHTLDQSYSIYELVGESAELTIGSKTKVLIAHFYDVETQKPLPSESQETEIYNLEETEDTGLVGIYEFEGTSCEVKAPEGYMIVVNNEQDENTYVESLIYDNLPEEETTEVTIFCISKEKLNAENKETPSETVDVPGEGSSNIETTDSTNNQTANTEETTSNNYDTNNENTSSSKGSTEESKAETDTSEYGVPPAEGNNVENQTEVPSDSSTGNNEGSTATEQQNEANTSDTVESLLVTENTSNEETSNDTQPTDISSSIDTSSETETNVSE